MHILHKSLFLIKDIRTFMSWHYDFAFPKVYFKTCFNQSEKTSFFNQSATNTIIGNIDLAGRVFVSTVHVCVDTILSTVSQKVC